MKKTFLFTLLLNLFIPLFAQTDVTKFLGIPVDGSKIEMIRKLKAKGFVSNKDVWEVLEGEFNGKNVQIHIATNNDKVCRIMVCDAQPVSEDQIKTRFNILCQQFMSNSKYECFSAQPIPEDEDISYEITVHKKRYEATFLQKANAKDSASSNLEKDSKEETENQTEGSNEVDSLLVSMKANLEKFKRLVWFTIQEYYGKYYICIFYDNEYNKANGEDL